MTPNNVMFAMAYATSDFFALITGAVATIAVAPQTLVPIAITVSYTHLTLPTKRIV